MAELLKVNNASMIFGGLRAVSNLTMQIDEGELIGLIGPNGAGKTTAFNMLTGVYEPSEGEITFNGQRINGKKPYQVTQMGIARTFQNIRLFSELSVLDNVKIAFNNQIRYGLAQAIGRFGGYFKEEESIEEKALALLKIFHLEKLRDEMAKNLPYGEQRRLEIARALATDPGFILLDEPFAGIDPIAVADIQVMVAHLARRGIGVLITDHNVRETLSIVDKAYILSEGKILLEGSPEMIANDPVAKKFYLGEEFRM